jgi:hypothetical protein
MRDTYHPIKTTLAVALALGAVAPGAASARLNLNPTPALPAPAPPAVQVIRVAAPAGFDWGDAGIGAAGGLGLSMLAVGGGLAIAQHRRSTPRRSASRTASAAS